MNNFEDAVSFFNENTSNIFCQLNDNIKNEITEVRVRSKKPIVIMMGQSAYFLTSGGKLINHLTDKCICVSDSEFDCMFGKVCAYSVHSHIDTMINGFITTPSGNRIGIASTAVVKKGSVTAVKDVSSFNIRIARDMKGCSRGILNALYVDEFPSIIVASPPGGGKTTVLRDMANLLSSGYNGKYRKVTIIDERQEISSFETGINTDVLVSFPKSNGIEAAVRTLSPDMIICDEIANDDEVEKIKSGFSSGVAFAVSVHIKSIDDIFDKSIVRHLILTNEFDYIVILEKYADEFAIINLRSLKNEDNRFNDDFGFFGSDGNFNEL